MQKKLHCHFRILIFFGPWLTLVLGTNQCESCIDCNYSFISGNVEIMKRYQARKQNSCRTGFSLVELVVVVLIMGILTAVAAPRMFDTSNKAKDAATRSSLSTCRDAIELYKAANGTYPPAATLAAALRPYLKGTFPAVQVSGTNQNNNVVESTADPITPLGTQGWAYNATTGEFVINHASCITW